MEPGGSGQFIVLILLLGLSAFFSASETCLISINKIRLKSMVNDHVKGAKDVESLIENTDKLLSAILIGNNVVNIAISSLSASIAMSYAGNNAKAVGLSTFIVTFFILVFGEVIPKTLAARHGEKLALKIAKPVKAIVVLLTPVVFILNKITGFILKLIGQDAADNKAIITEAELKSLVNLSHEEGIIEVEERTMIHNVFEFGDSDAEDVMTPRTDIIAVDSSASYSEIMEVFREEQFSRIPVYEEDIDHIVGVLNFKDFIFAESDDEKFNIIECMREPLFSYETKETSDLLKQMRHESAQMAIILDEYGGTAGLVTIEDLMEEIVGEIEDEFDEEEDKIVPLGEHEYMVDGMVKIDDFNEFTGSNLISEDFQSIGGYAIGIINDIPKQGDIIDSEEVTFIVEQAEKNRIEKLRVKVKISETEHKEEE